MRRRHSALVGCGGNRDTQTGSDDLSRWLKGEPGLGIIGTMTLGDFIYDWIRIDPTVITAVDFARVEDIANVFSSRRGPNTSSG